MRKVLGIFERRGRLNLLYGLCECSCGKKEWCRIINAKPQSNGCYSCAKLKHGDCLNGTTTRLHAIWKSMRARCLFKGVKNFKYYGARGISVCPKWHDYRNFKKWALSNGYKDNLTIDRIDNDGNYIPKNCTWITRRENAAKTRSTILITYDGKTMNMRQWSKELGFSTTTVASRIRGGMSHIEAVTAPRRRFIKGIKYKSVGVI